MEIDVWQIQNIIRAAAKEAVMEFVASTDPMLDEVTQAQAIRLGFGLRWLRHKRKTGELTSRRAGKRPNSPIVYSLKRLRELKNGDIDPLLRRTYLGEEEQVNSNN